MPADLETIDPHCQQPPPFTPALHATPPNFWSILVECPSYFEFYLAINLRDDTIIV